MIRIFATAWVASLLIAFALDRPIAVWVRDTVPVDKNRHVTHVVLEALKLPGWFPVTFTIALIVCIFHRRHVFAAVSLVVSGIVVGACYSIIKWIVGRHRPLVEITPWKFEPFIGGFAGLWKEKALCFPSGHASLSFATAICLTMLLPRFGWLFFLIATITACERVIENAHYLSDVVAGAGLGICVGWAITRAILSVDTNADERRRGFDVIPPLDKANG
jgi:membrane-associated phospholipid phosphatase